MIFDWLAREGWIVFNWWLLVTLAGLAVFPLLTRLLRGLPDRGYTLARAAGLLLVGFVYWLLATLGFLRNEPGGIVLAWLLVLALGLAVWLRQPFDWRTWWQQNRAAIITGEVLFAVMLLGFAINRAHLPDLTGTEKPMELAFMSAVQRSGTFPPNDPWLSGYAISYYYFGYVQEAMMAMLSGVSSTVGFNMMISLLFALTGLTSFGVVYNLVRSRTGLVKQRAALMTGLLGAVFVVLLGNFQLPLVELPYQTGIASQGYLDFWAQTERLSPKALASDQSGPQNWDHWWWFRASRVLTDTNLDGSPIGVQPIDEFPAFSFVLADVHPHVLALPFAMLALGLALNIVLRAAAPSAAETVFYALVGGGLVFLNLWDASYLIVMVGAEALRRLSRNGLGRLRGEDWWSLFFFGLRLIGLALLFYLPFFLSFSSQASGVLPNLLYPTLIQQYFVMFGPFVLIVAAFLLLEVRLEPEKINWGLGLAVSGALLLGLILLTLLFAVVGALSPATQGQVTGAIQQAGGLSAILPDLLQRRLERLPTTLLLLLAVGLVVARLFPRIPPVDALDDASLDERQIVTYPAASGFALLLVGAAVMLTLVPEFLYLRDNFGVRINSVFKFYYQAWLMFAVASAYGVYVVAADDRFAQRMRVLRRAFSGMVAVIVILGLLYPILAFQNRMFVESGRIYSSVERPLTLDGGPTTLSADDYASIMCFNTLVNSSDLVVLEAADPGSAYNVTGKWGRVAMLTGVPIVLGWQNHEGQWRGPTYSEVVGTRPQDVDQMYNDLRWDVVKGLLTQYGIDYVFFGETERNKYGAQSETKFADNLPVVCERGGSRFYRVTSMEGQG